MKVERPERSTIALRSPPAPRARPARRRAACGRCRRACAPARWCARAARSGPAPRSTISRSMSVALSDSAQLAGAPSARSSTFDRIGMVLRRSTTLCTWPSAFSRAARSIVSFMLATRRLADRSAMAGSPADRAPVAPARRASRRERSLARNSAGPSTPVSPPPAEPELGAGISSAASGAAARHPRRARGSLAGQLLDLAHRVHHRGVVAAAEFAADLGQRARVVSCLARYIATWRGRATTRARRLGVSSRPA